MDIVTFVTNLGGKFAPVDPSAVKTLEVQLTDEYNKVLRNHREKKEKNKMIKFEMDKLGKDFEEAQGAGDFEAARDVAHRMEQLKREMEVPTFLERSMAVLDKPAVKLVLMLSFGIVCALFARWLNGRRKGPEDDGPGGDSPDGGGPYHYGPPPGYPPYPYAPYGGGRRDGGRR